jgi:transposase
MNEELLQLLYHRLTNIEERLRQLLEEKQQKDFYSTQEVAEQVGKAEFTVREWCRLGRIRAAKRATGRGRSQEWMVSHAELTRVRNEGLLPLPKCAPRF